MKHEPGMAYNLNNLHKIFAVVSIILLLTVVWMMLDDFIRPWKGVQVKAMKVEGQVLSKKIKVQNKLIDQTKLKKLTANLKHAKKQVLSNGLKIKNVEADLLKLKGKQHREKIINSKYSSLLAQLTYQFEVKNKLDLLDKLGKYKSLLEKSNDQIKEYKSRFNKLKNKLSELKKEEIKAKKELEKVTGVKNRLIEAQKKTDPTTPVWLLRNAPFFDYLDPTLKISQIVLGNITEDRYFRQVPRVDRCITCHTFIDKKGFESQKNPFKTHPRLSLILGENSPHPIKKIGCTICHGGEGNRMQDFIAAGHTPSTIKQKKQWENSYNWHKAIHITRPMYKLKHTEAGCLKCHQGVDDITYATHLNKGRKLIRTYGCNGCHKIKGWEHFQKSGPSLVSIKDKISKQFFKNWVLNPRDFNPKAKMPSFFGQTNNSKDQFLKRNITEINALTEYILTKSKKYSPFVQYQQGDPNTGKNLISTVGCLGCHQVESISKGPYNKVKSRAGSYLTALGSKVNPDWLVSRLLRPVHYQASTVMPSFRLSNIEANNIASYLLSFKNNKFQSLPFGPIDKSTRDELLLEYLSVLDTKKGARAKLATLSDAERTLELGHRSVSKYGCFACHNLLGFADKTPIGPELTRVGSKPISQIAFGRQTIEHKRDVWFSSHLKNPRIWDQGTAKSFRDLQRMPNFNLPTKEIEALTIALLAQVSQKIPLEGIKRLSPNEHLTEKANKVMNIYNCRGCHEIDGQGGEIQKIYAKDLNFGPTRLGQEGKRVRSTWLHQFLQNVYKVRPALKIRMPSFNLTNEQRNQITRGLQAKANVSTFENNSLELVWESGQKEATIELFDELACNSCHTIGFSDIEAIAPDLHYAYNRLRPQWILNWLQNPTEVLDYTVMPNFWFDGESQEDEIMDGDPTRQMEALLKYIKSLSYNKFQKAD
ncbi:MAG: c-type cytochrome [Bacteriovoracaceae bacterium]|nr:c-type cytochrome [Bacteriovoracaceae bacterium]